MVEDRDCDITVGGESMNTGGTKGVLVCRLTELHKDVFGGIQSNRLKVLPHQDCDGSLVPVLRDLL